MYDHGGNKNAPHSAKAAVSQAERREGKRHPFIAAADVVDQRSGTRFSSRTTDLGTGGCFLDTLIPFEAGAKVRISIREGQNRFEATGIVVYAQSGLGMGVAFDPLQPDQLKALAAWLGEEINQDQQNQEQKFESAHIAGVPHGSDREALLRLVRLLISKGILSEAEAASVCSNPVFF
jgi:PilZ domain-containing protein